MLNLILLIILIFEWLSFWSILKNTLLYEFLKNFPFADYMECTLSIQQQRKILASIP